MLSNPTADFSPKRVPEFDNRSTIQINRHVYLTKSHILKRGKIMIGIGFAKFPKL